MEPASTASPIRPMAITRIVDMLDGYPLGPNATVEVEANDRSAPDDKHKQDDDPKGEEDGWT
jgi:hypothetical protein